VFAPLTWALVALSLAAMVYAVVLAARNKRIDWTVLGALGVIEVGLLAQLVVGIVQFAGTDRDVSGPFFIGYLIGSLIILPMGAFWALAESSRWGAGALAVTCLVIPILEFRLHDLWAV
jgi:lipopolysaccharide export LptBFGC system permease protein LptF